MTELHWSKDKKRYVVDILIIIKAVYKFMFYLSNFIYCTSTYSVIDKKYKSDIYTCRKYKCEMIKLWQNNVKTRKTNSKQHTKV